MDSYPFVSIIIPTVRVNEILRQCLDSLAEQDYPKERFEIILVSKEKLSIETTENTTSIHGVDFAHARNEGVKIAQGELVAFVDDDCIIPKDWISKAVPYFKDAKVAVIGGPALPLDQDSFPYRVGGYLFASSFTSGFASSRYKVQKKVYEAEEYSLIAANNMLRRDVFNSISGFNPEQVLSEENDLYFRLKTAGHKLLYVPEIFVFHRAKPIWLPIVKKVFFYATGRGVLMARKPASIKFVYLIPTFFVLGSFGLPILSLFYPGVFVITLVLIDIYLVLNIVNAFWTYVKIERHPLVPLVLLVATPLIHFAYGVGVLYGFYLYLRGDIARGRNLWSKD